MNWWLCWHRGFVAQPLQPSSQLGDVQLDSRGLVSRWQWAGKMLLLCSCLCSSQPLQVWEVFFIYLFVYYFLFSPPVETKWLSESPDQPRSVLCCLQAWPCSPVQAPGLAQDSPLPVPASSSCLPSLWHGANEAFGQHRRQFVSLLTASGKGEGYKPTSSRLWGGLVPAQPLLSRSAFSCSFLLAAWRNERSLLPSPNEGKRRQKAISALYYLFIEAKRPGSSLQMSRCGIPAPPCRGCCRGEELGIPWALCGWAGHTKAARPSCSALWPHKMPAAAFFCGLELGGAAALVLGLLEPGWMRTEASRGGRGSPP